MLKRKPTITLAQLRSLDREAFRRLRAILDRLPGHECVLTVTDKGVVHATVTKMGTYELRSEPHAHWKLIEPTKWFTLRSYALYHSIEPKEAYRRWRRGLVVGAFQVRGIVSVPASELTPEAVRRFDAKSPPTMIS